MCWNADSLISGSSMDMLCLYMYMCAADVFVIVCGGVVLCCVQPILN